MRPLLPALLVTALSGACTEQPQHESWAAVTSIAPHFDPKWYPDEVVVTARSQNRAMGSKSVPIARLNCRVGDTIRGSVQGLALKLDEHACER